VRILNKEVWWSMGAQKIVVIGTGYVGLTTGACMAHLGHEVICVDNDETKINSIRRGILPIYEENLSELVTQGCDAGNLSFTTNLSDAIPDTNFVFLCLPTPTSDDGSADITAIIGVVADIRTHLKSGAVVVNKSTVPVNSANSLVELINRSDIDVVSNPEFLREGSAVRDFLMPDRIVVGCVNPMAGHRVASLYENVASPIVLTDFASAETIKYMANSYLAMRISFINEVASFCHSIGADVLEVVKGLTLDKRIGATFLMPGPGWGGSCFPKDTRAISRGADLTGERLELIETAIATNTKHQLRIVKLITDLAGNNPTTSRVCLLGLTFKAGTDDVRESPALIIGQALVSEGFSVVAYDPMQPRIPTHQIALVGTIEEALRGADVVVVATEWEEFSSLAAENYADAMRGKLLFDLRYVLPREKFAAVGLEVITLGQRPIREIGK